MTSMTKLRFGPSKVERVNSNKPSMHMIARLGSVSKSRSTLNAPAVPQDCSLAIKKPTSKFHSSELLKTRKGIARSLNTLEFSHQQHRPA